MRTFMTTVLPWFLPGVAVSLVIGILVARPVAGWLRTSWLLALLFVVSLGTAIAATLPPDSDGLVAQAGGITCDLERMWPASPRTYLRLNDVSLNVLLFVPFGITVGMLPRSRRTRLVVLGAIALPFVIEATQSLVPVLGRGCESADVVDNLTGLVIGLALGRGMALARSRLASTGAAGSGGARDQG